jgi:hypothetical protein
MTQSSNPLKQYFRQPAIYLRLPSSGKHWRPGSINIPENGELPVYPMTAIDEITYRTPDALFNGQAVVNVIQSCIPGIVDAWACPTVDMNSILTAIRIASYGHELAMTSTCPNCQHQAEYGLDLRTVLDQQKTPNYSKTIKHGDLEILFKSPTYQNQHDTNTLQFDEQRILQMVPNSEMPDEEKVKMLNQVLKKITDITVDAIKWSVSAIRTPEALVTEPEHIHEFFRNCDRKLFAEVRDHIIALRESTDLKPLSIKCTECETEYQQPLTLDMSSFFEAAS